MHPFPRLIDEPREIDRLSIAVSDDLDRPLASVSRIYTDPPLCGTSARYRKPHVAVTKSPATILKSLLCQRKSPKRVRNTGCRFNAQHWMSLDSRLLGVSASGFYAWKDRPLSKRAVEHLALTAKIFAIHRRSGGAYGSPSIQAELADDHDTHVGKKRVARLMRVAGIKGLAPAKFVTTTIADPDADRALDKVDRQFTASGPDQLWVADITYVPTWAGFLFLAIVLDVFSRRIVGWAMANHLRTELVLDALDMALAQRRPESVIHHSDSGCQYTSYAFGKRCREANVVPSMGSVGDAYDNAMAESFFCDPSRSLRRQPSRQILGAMKLRR